MKKNVYLLTLMIVLSSCTSTFSETPQILDTYTAVPKPTPQSPSPTSTPVLPLATSTIDHFIPEAGLRTQCLNLTMDDSIEKPIGGIVLASDRYKSVILWDSQQGPVLFLNPTNDEIISNIRVSPDRTKLAYHQINLDQNENILSEELIVISYDGSEQQSISWEAYFSHFDWIDNENVITYHATSQEIPLPLVVVNLATGNTRELSLSVGDVNYTDNIDWGMYRSSRSVYDSTLTRVVYLGENGFYAVLQDYDTGRELARIEYGGYFTPIWSPNGNQVLVVKPLDIRSPRPYELFTMERDGEIQQLTHLSDYFDLTEIRSYVWSPDGNFIAFWLNASQNQDQPNADFHLAVLDTTTGITTDYCISTPANDYAFPPIWSPDAKQLVVRTQGSTDNNRNIVVLVDTTKGLAFQIAEDLEPVGWIVTP